MRLETRSGEDFDEIKKINDNSFFGVEKPPLEALRYNFETGDVFLSYGTSGFAIVTRKGGTPYLWSLAVDPSNRGRGLGSGLLEEIAATYRAQGETKIELTVNVNNSAQKLYFDHGFRVIRVVPKYYGEASGLRMRRMLW